MYLAWFKLTLSWVNFEVQDHRSKFTVRIKLMRVTRPEEPTAAKKQT